MEIPAAATVLWSFYMFLLCGSALDAVDLINSIPYLANVWENRPSVKQRNADEGSTSTNLKGEDLHIQNSNKTVSNSPDEEYGYQKRLVEGKIGRKIQFRDGIGSRELNQTSSIAKKKSKMNRILGEDYFEMELQIILDTVLVQAIENSEKNEILDYVNIFIHTVNHMYSMSYQEDQTFPDFKVKVVQLELLSEAMESEIFISAVDEETLDIQKVLINLRKQAKKRKYDKYDHTMLLTGRDLYRKNNGQYQADVLGVAFYNGSCSKTTNGKYNALSVVEDVGGRFLGVYAAVHEIAHNLGAKHDSKTTSVYNCQASRGYIMSPVTERTENMFKFSECSLSSLSSFFYSNYGKCLTEGKLKPLFPENVPAQYPGDVYSTKDICEHLAEINFGNELNYESSVNPGKSPNIACKQISCLVVVNGNRKYTLEPPFAPGENTSCGNNGRCVSGNCVEQ